MPYGLVSKDERRTSNTERPTPNENKYQLPNIEHLFTFDVGRSMFDVLFFVPPGQKQLSANGVPPLAYFLITTYRRLRAGLRI
jgi:hypothetical protein